jgi:hypothetical protein
MNRTDQILANFLNETGWTKPIKMGERKPAISNNLVEKLFNDLVKENRFNRLMVITLNIMFFIIFIVGIYIGLDIKGESQTTQVIFGGAFITSELSIIVGLSKFWMLKCKIDLIKILVMKSRPEESANIIEIILYGKRK